MKRILVAGELNADMVMSGLPSLPVLGRELVGTGFTMAMGSSSAITAARLAALGKADPDYAVDFVGLIGDDDIGRFVESRLRGFGVHTDHVQTVSLPTGVTIALTYARDRAFVTYPGAMTAFDGAALTPELLSRFDHLHVGSFFLQTSLQPHLARIFEMARAQGVTTSLDVGWDPTEVWLNNPYLAPALAQVDDFLPNEDEAAALAPDIETLRRLVRGTLIVKRGAKGTSAYADTVTAVPALTVAVVDTTGAGDAFNAGYIYARRIRGEPLALALRFAIVCGAQAVTQVGGATNAPSEAAVRAQLAEQNS
ncbi:MAG: carbohydrate kinase family protein [Anaerolineae bacterium]|nr:carbohydrate kinase family protein [Anaerolineae bacterium]